MNPLITRPSTTVHFNGIPIQVKSWKVTAGTSGAIGTCRVTCGKKALAAVGITPDQLKGSEPIDIFIDDGVHGSKHIFGGNHDDSESDPTADTIEITGRDAAALLRDSSRSITSQASQNLLVEQVVAELVGHYGIPAKITATGVKAGVIYKDLNLFTPKPRNAWAMLQLLAKAVGFEVFVQPGGTTGGSQLFFGPSPAPNLWTLTYMANAGTNSMPIMHPRIRRNPRRNGSFKVFVLSSHPAHGLTLGAAQNVPTTGGAISFFNNGGSVVGVGTVLSALGGGEQVYTYRVNGKTADACSRLAQSLTLDIAKREVIVSGTLDGINVIQPRDSVLYVEGRKGDLGSDVVGGRPFRISEVEHSYSLPEPGQLGAEGYQTIIKTLSLPNVDGGNLFF